MKPIFTIHEGEFLVGDHISRALGRRFSVWVPASDQGIDLLVTPTRGRGRPVGIQVKASRGYGIPKEFGGRVLATSWFSLKPKGIRKSHADLWALVIVTPGGDRHFVVIPRKELKRRIPRGAGKMWNLYLWVCQGGACYQLRGVGKADRFWSVNRGSTRKNDDYSEWLERWDLLDEFSRGHRK